MKPRTFDSVYDLRERLNHQQKAKLGSGQDLITKVYPSDVIPDQYIERKRDYRPNNFINGDPQMQAQINRASNSHLQRVDRYHPFTSTSQM